jgi:hypothetical protein
MTTSLPIRITLTTSDSNSLASANVASPKTCTIAARGCESSWMKMPALESAMTESSPKSVIGTYAMGNLVSPTRIGPRRTPYKL